MLARRLRPGLPGIELNTPSPLSGTRAYPVRQEPAPQPGMAERFLSEAYSAGSSKEPVRCSGSEFSCSRSNAGPKARCAWRTLRRWFEESFTVILRQGCVHYSKTEIELSKERLETAEQAAVRNAVSKGFAMHGYQHWLRGTPSVAGPAGMVGQ